MENRIDRREFGKMKCVKCGGETELFGNLPNNMFKYYCLSCYEIFFSEIFYVESLPR